MAAKSKTQKTTPKNPMSGDAMMAASLGGTNRDAGNSSGRQVSDSERRRLIAETAYRRAEQRGFADGDPVADWLAAEKQVNEQLARQHH